MLIRYFLLFVIYFIFKFEATVFAKHNNQTWKNSFQSVVSVLPTWPGYEKRGFGSPKEIAPEGTGFYFNYNKNEKLSEYVMTAFHVIKKAKKVEIEDQKGKIEVAKIVYVDEKTDIAVLKVKTKRKAINFSENNIFIGEHACAIGNSFGLGVSLSCGVISALNRKNLGFNAIENFLQTDAPINPGDSGAPLIDYKGELIGMVDAIYTKEADIDAGVNFAIDRKLIESVLLKIKLK